MALTENRRLQRVACGLSLTTALVAAPEAQAQDGSPYDLGTLILTGLNLSLTASETGTSVSVVDAQDIARDPGNATVQEAVREVPNVYFPGTTGGPVVRGQQSEGPNGGASAFFAGTVPRFSIAIDGRRAGFNELSFGNTSIWDVESIEVYRGPQTTTQGANSIAGAIVVNTKDPTFEREGSLQVSVGSYERQQYSAAFSQAVGEDVALRFSLDHSERDSYVDYDNPNFDPGDAPTRPSNTTGRIKALWAPQEIPGLEVLVGYSYSETEGAQGEDVEEPFKDRENSAVNLAGWRTQVHAATMDATYELGNGLILDNRLVYSDTETRRYVNPGSQGDAWVDQSDLSNDLRLSFGGENTPFRGVAGLYLSRVEGSEAVDLRDFFGGVSDFDDTKESLGLYGEVTYDLTDRFSATGGLRYQQDRVQRDGVVDFLGVVAVEFNETYEALLPSLTLAYDLTDDVTAGFAYSKGMNPGGVSYSFTQGQYVDFDEEIAHNYELFVRGALLDDRLNLSGNLFYTDLRNAQRAVSTRISTNVVEIITVNAEEAVSYGLEVAADYQASDTLMIWGSAGWLKTEFRKFSSAVDDHEGNSFGEAPEFTMTLGASYDVTDRFTVSGDVTHVAGYYSDDLNTDDLKTEAYTLANVQASYTADFGGTFFAYVNNVADIDAATSLSFARGGGAKTASLVAPREFGIGLRYDF